MKVSALIVASALGLAAAAPIRIIILPANGGHAISTETKPNIQIIDTNPFRAVRIGHAAAQATPVPVATWSQSSPPHPCGGLRAKMDRLSDKARELLGLPPLDRQPHRFAFASVRPADMTQSWPDHKKVTIEHHAIFWKEGKAVYRQNHGPHDKFAFRLHHALNQLGPWEGRAISFVLGCGIGVLIRMFFVLFILLIRARRAATVPVTTSGPIHLEVDQIVFIAPPEYIDDKAPLYSPSPDAIELVVEEKEETPQPTQPTA